MNMRRFTGRNSREAMQKVREAFGDEAIVLSNKPCAEGIEILALPPQGLDAIQGSYAEERNERVVPSRQVSRPLAAPTAAADVRAGERAGERAATDEHTSVQDDVKRLAMSTLSFQDYVRERLLKRRQAALGKADTRHVEPSFDMPPRDEVPAQALAQRLAQRAQERAQVQRPGESSGMAEAGAARSSRLPQAGPMPTPASLSAAAGVPAQVPQPQVPHPPVPQYPAAPFAAPAQPLREPPVLREEVAAAWPAQPSAAAPSGPVPSRHQAASPAAAQSGYWAAQSAPSLADAHMSHAVPAAVGTPVAQLAAHASAHAASMPAQARQAAEAAQSAQQRNLAPTGMAMNAQMMEELRNVKGLIEERFGAIAFLEKLQRSRSNAQLTQKLLDCGFSPALIRKMVDAMPPEVTDGSADETVWATEVLERNLLTGEHDLAVEDQGGVFALIGSTGVGKTTSTAKIAAAFAAKHGAANLGLITLDAYRVGAHEQLRAYGRILGVPVHTAHDRAALEDLLELLSAKKLILIDTAGIAQRDARSRELLEMLAHPAIRRLVVVNASAQGETIDDVLVAYNATSAAGIVLSKLDEAVKLGPALDALIRHRLKVVGVANGQRVPEDWHRLSARAMVHRALRSGGSPAYRLDPNEVNLVFTTPSSNPAVMTAQMQAHAQAHLQAQAQQAQVAARRAATQPTGY